MARPRSDIRERIINAARARFLADGVDGASLRKIAKDAGTNIGMVYYYFETKDGLLLEVIEERYAGVLADLETIFGRPAPFLDRVEAASARLGSLSDEEFDVVRIVIGALIRPPAERKAKLLGRFQAGHLGLIMRAAAEASGADVDERHALPVLMMATFGAAIFPQLMRRMAGDLLPFPMPDGSQLAAGLTDVLRHGLGKRTHQAD